MHMVPKQKENHTADEYQFIKLNLSLPKFINNRNWKQ